MKSYISVSVLVMRCAIHSVFAEIRSSLLGQPCKEKRKSDKSSGLLLKYRWSGSGME